MYVLLNDFLPTQVREADARGVTMKDMQDALKEHGWNLSYNSMAPCLGGLVRDGLLLKIAKTKPLRYRLPLKVTVKVEQP